MVRQSRIPLLAEEGRMRHRAKPPKAAQTGWSDRHVLDFAELTTPALRATPPLRGGEFVNAIFKRNADRKLHGSFSSAPGPVWFSGVPSGAKAGDRQSHGGRKCARC